MTVWYIYLYINAACRGLYNLYEINTVSSTARAVWQIKFAVLRVK